MSLNFKRHILDNGLRLIIHEDNLTTLVLVIWSTLL
jgi:hypothetical protein